MTLKYAELMERVAMTDEMREQVLSGARQKFAAQKRRTSMLRRAAALTACLVLTAAGIFTLSRPDVPELQTPAGITEAADARSLGEAVGFEVRELTGLPFEPEHTTYTAINDLAEISCVSGGKRADYRKSPGPEANSGDYNVYPFSTELSCRGMSVKLQGAEDGRYTLAEWFDGEFSYSLNLSIPLNADEWTALIEANRQ